MDQDASSRCKQSNDEDKPMKELHLSWDDIHSNVLEILRQMQIDGWSPDYVVGITRGGLVPATMISHYLGCTMHTLQVRLQDGEEFCESNFWMAEEAFGYVPKELQASKNNSVHDIDLRKRILIVDDINDTGATLNWIQQDWQSGCLPDDPIWQGVWGGNVRVAVVVDNESSRSKVPVRYSGQDINKAQDPVWVVFPWEKWWKLI